MEEIVKKNSGHGGRRPGAGRPPKKDAYKKGFTVRLHDHHLEQLKALSSESRGVAVVARELLIKALDNMKKNGRDK